MAASYPGAVKTFATRSNGQTIDASHINDLQDEVNAIESGLLNGTAPLTSSNTAVNTLQVSSLSTFALRPLMPPPQMAVVYLASTVTIGSSQLSTVQWTAQQVLTNSSMHSTTTNPERLIPQTTGVYQFTAGIRLAAMASTGIISLNIRDSSGAEIGRQRFSGSSGAIHLLQATGYKRFDVVGGYAVCVVEVNGQSTMSLSSGVGESWFSAVKL